MIGENDISTQLVNLTLGANTNDVGSLCIDDDINMYSYNKPHKPDNKAGLVYDEKQGQLIYDRPTIYNLGDFRGYNHSDRGVMIDTTSDVIQVILGETNINFTLNPSIGDSRINYPEIFKVLPYNLFVKVEVYTQRNEYIDTFKVVYNDIIGGKTNQVIRNSSLILSNDTKLVFSCSWYDNLNNKDLGTINKRYQYYYKGIKVTPKYNYAIGGINTRKGFSLVVSLPDKYKPTFTLNFTNNTSFLFSGTTQLQYRYKDRMVSYLSSWYDYPVFSDFNSLSAGKSKSKTITLPNPPSIVGISDWDIDFNLILIDSVTK